MKPVTPSAHAIIDYVSVVVLVAAPAVLGLAGSAAALAYALATIHLLMTVLTAFPGGVVKAIPHRVHGMVELVVGLVLLIGPWVLSAVVDLGAVGKPFYSAFGLVLLAVWALTDHGPAAQNASRNT